MTTARSGADEARPASLMTPRWALKRALIGLGVLLAFVTVMALLLDASIEPDTNAQTVAGKNPA